jgi:Zn-dependent M28 family amino/carboxypeptidase
MKNLQLVAWLLAFSASYCQSIDKVINAEEVERVEKILSADDMQGRASFSPGIEKAANFISSEFRAAGLQGWNNSDSYRQPFSMIKAKLIVVTDTLDDQSLDPKNLIAFTSKPELSFNQDSGFEKAFIRPGDDFLKEVFKYVQGDKNYLVLVDTVFSKNFIRLWGFKQQRFKSERSVLFVLTTMNPQNYKIYLKHEITEAPLANLVGILPGKNKKNEYVIFSAHYDHLGIGKPDDRMDSVFNGANDDASGCTAVIMLAKYFSKLNNNERTLIFATFTAEEIGEYGSQYFSKQFDPAKVVAMFNIEMIGTESKWGTNSAFITGYEKTDMGLILEKNLEGSRFRFYPDPYPKQGLFYRSDNASLARQGVPAHTLSTSKMDSEKYYHTRGDEIKTLDMNNMAEIIKAIAISSRSIIEGKDTPSRVTADKLR